MRQWIPLASALLYWGAVAIRAQLLKRQIGRSPNLKPRTGKEWALWAGWTAVVIGWAVSGFVRSSLSYEGPVSFWTGIAAILLGLAGTLWAHASMGDAWRIGIDPTERTSLVMRGPYRRMRHPIYSFQCLILIGVFLVKPSATSLLLLVLHRLLVSVKIHDEEAYLERTYGPIYKEYRQHTGSLWPKV